MTAFERVMNTIQGKPVDRVPVFAVLGIYGGKLIGKDLRTVYSNVDTYVAAQTAVYEKFGFDMLLAPFDYSAVGEAWGGTTEFFLDQAPNLKRPKFSKSKDILKNRCPDPYTDGRLPFILESAAKLYERFGREVPIIATVSGPCVLPALAVGLETWLDTVLFDTSCADDVMAYTGEFFVAWVKALKETGITAVVLTEGLAAAEIMPREFFTARCLTHFNKVLSSYECPTVFHHSGGSINHVLDLIKDIPNVFGFSVGSKDDLTTARSMINTSQILIGNIDILQLPLVSRGMVYEQCLEKLREAGSKGKYILSTAGADVPIHTHEDNLHAMIEASLAYAEESGAV